MNLKFYEVDGVNIYDFKKLEEKCLEYIKFKNV